MTKLTPMQLQKNLAGVEYPASKKDLIKNAEEKGADEKILRTLKQLPSQDYETPTAVSHVVKRITLKRGTLAKLTPMQLQKNLVGVEYPVSKKDLIKNAEEKGADEKILRELKKLSNQQYETITAVSQALRESK